MIVQVTAPRTDGARAVWINLSRVLEVSVTYIPEDIGGRDSGRFKVQVDVSYANEGLETYTETHPSEKAALGRMKQMLDTLAAWRS